MKTPVVLFKLLSLVFRQTRSEKIIKSNQHDVTGQITPFIGKQLHRLLIRFVFFATQSQHF